MEITMSDNVSRKAILGMIDDMISGLEPHGHPAMGDDEIRIKTASEIARKILQMTPASEQVKPVISDLSHGAGGTLVDREGNVICTLNLHGKMTVQQAFAYAEAFIKAVNHM
jgi:hypothetical protein